MRMGKLTNKLYYDFQLDQTGFDFMGYTFDDKKELSFHHIQPKNYGGKTLYNNGALLVRDTSHNYIHTIENVDFKLFIEISQLLKDEHLRGAITLDHLRAIHDILELFEKKYNGGYTSKGLPIIKDEFIKRRIKLWKVILTCVTLHSADW